MALVDEDRIIVSVTVSGCAASTPVVASMPLSRPRPASVQVSSSAIGSCTSAASLYGAFRPDAQGNEYHDLDTIERDFALMAANDINTVRIPTPRRPAPCSTPHIDTGSG